MKTLTFTRPGARVNQLHDELIAAVPTAFVRVLPDGTREALGTVESVGDEIRITVADGAHERAITAVVQAHAPRTVFTPKTAADYRTEWATATTTRKLDILAALLGLRAPEPTGPPPTS